MRGRPLGQALRPSVSAASGRTREGMEKASLIKGRAAVLFRKDIDPCCIYCKYGSPINIEKVACLKRGVVPRYGACRKFVYDPLKREPERPRKLQTKVDGEPFKL